MSNKLWIAEILFAVALFVFASAFPAIDELSEKSLAFHMSVQHLLQLVAGLLLGVQLARVMPHNRGFNIALLLLAIVLFGTWHIPVAWDAALASELGHAVMHISVFIAGAFFYVSFASLGSSVKWTSLVLYLIFSSILGANALGGIRGRQFYQSYSASQHTELGAVMIVTMPAVFLLVALSHLYLPQLADAWNRGKLSPIFATGILIAILVIGLFVIG